jgi:hypothetical protein
MPKPISPVIRIKRYLIFPGLLLALMLVGCREFLPYRTEVPDISGILLQRGVPLPDVVIYSCLKSSSPKRCAKYKKTMTDSQGHFYFDSMSDVIRQISDIGDSSFSYNINFQYLGRDYHWNARGGEMPENVNLRCDISHQELCTVHNFIP